MSSSCKNFQGWLSFTLQGTDAGITYEVFINLTSIIFMKMKICKEKKSEKTLMLLKILYRDVGLNIKKSDLMFFLTILGLIFANYLLWLWCFDALPCYKCSFFRLLSCHIEATNGIYLHLHSSYNFSQCEKNSSQIVP